MNFYAGNIAEAVKLSKEKDAIFVVYVEGKMSLPYQIIILFQSVSNLSTFFTLSHFGVNRN